MDDSGSQWALKPLRVRLGGLACAQGALQAHENQLRASLAREAEAAEARGRKLGAQEVMAARDEVQKKLSNTEAEFRSASSPAG